MISEAASASVYSLASPCRRITLAGHSAEIDPSIVCFTASALVLAGTEQIIVPAANIAGTVAVSA